MRLRSIRVAAIHELPLQCVFLHQSYKAHLQTEMVSEFRSENQDGLVKDNCRLGFVPQPNQTE